MYIFAILFFLNKRNQVTCGFYFDVSICLRFDSEIDAGIDGKKRKMKKSPP